MANRPIKFRAWDGEQMLKHVPIESVSIGKHLEMQGTTLTLMQFTGLTDKNGKEIYEGDVVKSHAVPEHMDADTISFVYWNVRLAKFGLAEVEHYRLYDKSINGLPFDWGGWKEHEVIGNVFENPELLTKLTNDV